MLTKICFISFLYCAPGSENDFDTAIRNRPPASLKPLVPADAEQIQRVFPRWEIVRYLVASVPWPYPQGAANQRSVNLSQRAGMRLVRTEKAHYVAGVLDSELWEIDREAWRRIRRS